MGIHFHFGNFSHILQGSLYMFPRDLLLYFAKSGLEWKYKRSEDFSFKMNEAFVKKKSTYQFFWEGLVQWFFGFCKKLISLMYYFSSSSHSKMNVKKKSTYQFFFPGLPRLALVFSKKLISSMYFFWGGSHTKMNEKKKSTYHFFFFTPASENLGSGLKLIFSFISTNILFFYIFPYKHHEIQKSGFEWKKQGKKITRKSKCFHCIYYQNHL